MIKVGIIGATGYAGSELVRIITQHPEAEIKTLTSQSYSGKAYEEVYENYRHRSDYICEEENIEKMAEECDVIFLALPHGVASKKITEDILSKTKIIDLGADFRLQDLETYEKWYTTHYAKDILPEAIVEVQVVLHLVPDVRCLLPLVYQSGVLPLQHAPRIHPGHRDSLLRVQFHEAPLVTHTRRRLSAELRSCNHHCTRCPQFQCNLLFYKPFVIHNVPY